MDILRLQVILSLLLFVCSACSVPEQKKFTLIELQVLDKIDRIEITHSRDFKSESYHIKTIDNPKQVKSIVQMFRNYADDWQNYYPYASPGLLVIEFYNGEEFKLGIMIGHTTFSSGEPYYHLSQAFGPGRPLTKEDFEALIEVLGVEEQLAEY